MDGPGQGSASDHGLLRASREDRERVIDVIKTAFVQDRLDLDELAGRVGQALTARTYGQLAVLTADLPRPGPLAAGLAVPGVPGAEFPGPSIPGTGAERPRAVRGPRTGGQIMGRAAVWTVISVLAMAVLVRSGLLVLAFFALPVPVGIVGYGILEAIETGWAGRALAHGPGRHRRLRLDGPAERVRAGHGGAALWPAALR
jgi:hypothetical protein